MALFGRKKETHKTANTTPQPTAVANTVAAPLKKQKRALETVLLKPHITEKAVSASERGVYVFQVRKDATKRDIAEAIKAQYNVSPKKVHIVNTASRRVLSRRLGRRITTSGMKKAYVYLKEGDTITIM